MPKKVTALTAKNVARKKNQPTAKHPTPSAAALSQNALADPAELTPEKILALQHTVGNQAVQRLLAQTPAAAPKPADTRLNRTGLPAALKAGVENLSGVVLDDVRVRPNSPQPADLPGHEQNLRVTGNPIQRTIAKTDLDPRYSFWLSNNEAEFLQHLKKTRKTLASVDDFLNLEETTKELVQQEMENSVSTRAQKATTQAVTAFGQKLKPIQKPKFERSKDLKSAEKLTKIGDAVVTNTFKRELADLKSGTPLYHCTKAAQAIMSSELKGGTGIRDIGSKFTLDPSLVGRISFTTDPDRKLAATTQLVLILKDGDMEQYGIFHFSEDEYVATSPIPGSRVRLATPQDKETSKQLGFVKK